MKDSEQKSENPSESKKRHLLIRMLQHTAVAAAITTLISWSLFLFWSSYIGFRQETLARYDSLRNHIQKLTFIDEEMYIFCQHFEEFSNPRGSLASNQMFNFRDAIMDQFEKIFDDVKTLEFISYSGYYKLYQFICWHDAMASSQQGICKSGLLLSPMQMYKWRPFILEEITKDRKLISQNPVYSLRYYFTSLLRGSGRDLPYQVKCEKNPIPSFVSAKI